TTPITHREAVRKPFGTVVSERAEGQLDTLTIFGSTGFRTAPKLTPEEFHGPRRPAVSFEEYAVAVLGPDTDVNSFATQSFVGLGGAALRAMRLAAVLQERCGVRIRVVSLLRDTPLAEVLAEVGAAGPVAHHPAAEAAGGAEALSPAQRGMWVIERVTGGSPYNLVFTCFVEAGRLEPETLRQAVAETAARHPGLRTVYREQDGDVVPVLLADHVPQVTFVDHAGEAADFDDHVRAVAADHGRQPFDLAAAPGLRFLHLGHPAGRQAIVLLAHHMVLDGWA